MSEGDVVRLAYFQFVRSRGPVACVELLLDIREREEFKRYENASS